MYRIVTGARQLFWKEIAAFCGYCCANRAATKPLIYADYKMLDPTNCGCFALHFDAVPTGLLLHGRVNCRIRGVELPLRGGNSETASHNRRKERGFLESLC